MKGIWELVQLFCKFKIISKYKCNKKKLEVFLIASISKVMDIKKKQKR